MNECKAKDCKEKEGLKGINVELDMGNHVVKIDGKYCPPHYKEVITFLVDKTVVYTKSGD
jgi:hypothetical protein